MTAFVNFSSSSVIMIFLTSRFDIDYFDGVDIFSKISFQDALPRRATVRRRREMPGPRRLVWPPIDDDACATAPP